MNTQTASLNTTPSSEASANRMSTAVLIKPLVFLLLLSPFMWLVYAVFASQLGENPIEAITDFTGEWAFRILLLSLAMTPLRQMLKQPWPIRYRRMIGLFAFFYVCLHFLTYLVLDNQLDMSIIVSDILDRPYITAGTVGFFIMIALALTSTKGMMKRLGKRWKSLHQWVYVAGAAACLHYIWLARGDRIEPFVYLAVFLLLMMPRFKKWLKR